MTSDAFDKCHRNYKVEDHIRKVIDIKYEILVGKKIFLVLTDLFSPF